MRLTICCMISVLCLGTGTFVRAEAKSAAPFDELSVAYVRDIQPLLNTFCLDCHSTEAKEGELDLERFASLESVREDAAAWQKVRLMLRTNEMPPEESPQPTSEQRKLLQSWVETYLDAEALANAGDPGPVLLRRLNNAEYTYTIQELTGIDSLDPAREFPVDGAAGEGFTNTGNSLSMSPAMIEKYVAAGAEIAAHLVLLPDGIRFSEGTTSRDWANENMAEIRQIYLKHTTDGSDASILDRWSVADPKRATEEDGRIDLTRYFSALIRHRDALQNDLSIARTLAAQEQLNPKYFEILATMLVSKQPDSLLLNELRERWKKAGPEQAGPFANSIRSWQDQLWKFNSVGHFGSIRPWQEATNPISTVQNFRIPIPSSTEGKSVKLYLQGVAPGATGKSTGLVWRSPRIERSGKPPLLLRDVRGVSAVLAKTRQQTLSKTSQYLAAAYELRANPEQEDLTKLVEEYKIDPVILRPWLNYLGIVVGQDVQLEDYLHTRIDGLGGKGAVQGWQIPGLSALSIVGNASDETVLIPGTVPPHTIAVHPRPERWIAVGWKSSIDGAIKIAPRVKDAHDNCGNGVSWSVELRRGSQRRVLLNGNVDLGKEATIEPVEKFAVRQGDVISLIIDARDGSHVCDLTEIDLEITEQDSEKSRVWSLTKDCANSMEAGNPHADSFGNQAIWHFYTGAVDGSSQQIAIPADSTIGQWLASEEKTRADELAQKLQLLLTDPTAGDRSESDKTVLSQLQALDGPLFSQIEYAALASKATPEQLNSTSLGLDPNQFEANSENLVLEAPFLLEVELPVELCREAEFVASVGLFDVATPEQIAQVNVAFDRPKSTNVLPGVPFLVSEGTTGESRAIQAMDDFREFFPAVFCYPQIVPVDEVVTLVLHHREDAQLSRLMLDEREHARLDQLWSELHYVSQDALAIVTGYEQLMEFATQDADPTIFEKLRKPIHERAAEFQTTLIASQPNHLDALLEFADRAYRKKLSEQDVRKLRSFYDSRRADGMPHVEAIRLTLIRILTSPKFLYRLEQPGPGTVASAVSNEELATRLSYFLWSSLPDQDLRAAADAGRLQTDEEILSQTKRMLQNEHVRRLAIEFACQWLHVREFDKHDEKNETKFPEFAKLRGAMYEESILFFQDLFSNNGSILEILDADHTFLNEALATHYGIPGVQGDLWRKVEGVKKYSRGGILSQATVLASQSGASRTSPILRGNWISETILGERLPRPPPNVPVLPESVPAGLTERQLIEQHSSVAECAKCHRRIDPYGFVLENFDTIGRFRTNSESGDPLDVASTVMDGTPIEGISGLQNYLLTVRRDTFVRNFCKKLLGYALGRSVQLSDEPLIDRMIQNLEQHNYKFSTAIESIVLSRQFREIRGKDFATVE